jgi:hypothetical protein
MRALLSICLVSWLLAQNALSQVTGPGLTPSGVAPFVLLDSRQMTNASLKSVSVPTGPTPLVVFTNNGPCTITNLHFSLGAISTESALTNLVITIQADNVINSCQLCDLFACRFGAFRFETPVISAETLTGFAGNEIGGSFSRQIYVNCYTNCSVSIACPAGQSLTDWSDISALLGAPVLNGVYTRWHVTNIVAQQIAGNTTFTPFQAPPGTNGTLECVVYSAGSTNGQTYLEPQPLWNHDGTNFFAGNGTEDSFETGFYGNGGQWVLHNEIFGWSSETWLRSLVYNGFTDGHTGYAFKHHLTWTNSAFWAIYQNGVLPTTNVCCFSAVSWWSPL